MENNVKTLKEIDDQIEDLKRRRKELAEKMNANSSAKKLIGSYVKWVSPYTDGDDIYYMLVSEVNSSPGLTGSEVITLRGKTIVCTPDDEDVICFDGTDSISIKSLSQITIIDKQDWDALLCRVLKYFEQ